MGHVDFSLVDWSRAQFALTAMYHYLFVPLTLGLSFIVAFLSIKFLLGFIKNHSFISFGVYRIILVLCFLLAKV